MNIDVYKDMGGTYRWRAVAENGRIVADSAEGYVTRSNAVRAANMVVMEFRSVQLTIEGEQAAVGQTG